MYLKQSKPILCICYGEKRKLVNDVIPQSMKSYYLKIIYY